jgi:ectoine hydroxylase
MKIGLTAKQRRAFDETGFLVVENVLKPGELTKLNRVVDRLYTRLGGDDKTGRLELRNCVAHDPALLQMVDHAALLPAIVDLMGPDIKIRTSELDVRPPLPRAAYRLGKNPGRPENWHIDGPIYGYPTVDGRVPMMEVRVGYHLTDLRAPESGQLWLVPGSHRDDYRYLADPDLVIPPEKIVRVDAAPGSAVIFRTGVWHCASPNMSQVTRKILYFAYTYRWIQGSDYLEQEKDLLDRCTKVQRQLLGAAPNPKRGLLGSAPERTPCSFYWFTEPADIPLLALYRRLQQKRR